MTDVAPAKQSSTPGLTIIQGGWEFFDRVEPLWNQQRDFHFARTPQWKQGMTWKFADPRLALIAKGTHGHLLALASIEGRDVGNGISMIEDKSRGELELLLVAPQFRSQGVGNGLMTATLQWFAGRGIEDFAIEALVCNEGAVRFYARCGYQPRSIVMKRPLPVFPR